MNDEISLGQAFRYCFTQPGYWIFLILGIIAGALLIRAALRRYNKNADVDFGVIGMLAIGVVIIFAVILAKPVGVKANTTKEQAARGVYIE